MGDKIVRLSSAIKHMQGISNAFKLVNAGVRGSLLGIMKQFLLHLATLVSTIATDRLDKPAIELHARVHACNSCHGIVNHDMDRPPFSS